MHSGPGSRLRLACEVSGEPRPALTWYFGETKVSPSPVTGVSLSHSHDKHSLTIERTDITSFGNYSCVARNKLGVFKKHIEVHGRPTEANFLRERSHSGQRSFELAWQVGWGRRKQCVTKICILFLCICNYWSTYLYLYLTLFANQNFS